MDTFAALKAFVMVVESGGFSSASRRMGVAASSITRQVDALENSLGTLLLNRSTRNVTLTNSGESYFEHATRILADLENANIDVSEMSGPPRGLLRVSLPVAFARLHIAPILPAFTRRYPDIQLDLTMTDSIVDLVEQRLDMTIRLGVVESPGLIARKLAPHKRVVCAAPDYLGENGVPQSPAELSSHNCLTFAYGSGINRWSFAGPSTETICVSGNLRANNSEVIREAAIGGMGLALMPSWLVGSDIESGRLRVLLPEWEANPGGADGAISAVFLPNRRTSKKVRAFVDFLTERFGSPPYWDRTGDQ